MKGLDLFAGIGGISQALSPWVETIHYCEFDPFCRKILDASMKRGQIEFAPVTNDVREIHGGKYDFISAGFPCQDISSVGLGKGLAGERSGLFFEVVRLIGEIRPQFVLLENVAAITFRGGWRVTHELAKLGYDLRWGVVSAYSFGASHLRQRWIALAHPHKDRSKRSPLKTKSRPSHQAGGLRHSFPPPPFQEEAWDRYIIENPSLEPIVRRGPHGLRNGTNRIGVLGNSVVPVQIRGAFEKLMGIA